MDAVNPITQSENPYPAEGLPVSPMVTKILEDRKQQEKEDKKLKKIKSELLAEIKTNARAAFIKEIGHDFVEIIRALRDNALGKQWAEKVTPQGQRVMYKPPMNTEAAIYLTNQMIGKPTETVEHVGHVTLNIDKLYDE